MNKAKNGAKVDGERMCSILGISHVTLRGWVDQGCPVQERGHRGKSHVFDTLRVITWRDKNIINKTAVAVQLEEAERRKAVAEAELSELKLAEKRGELVDANATAIESSKAWANARQRVLSVPAAGAAQVTTMTPAEAEAFLTDALSSAMGSAIDEYASGSDSEGESDHGAGDGDVPAPAKADRKPVGRRRKNPKPGGNGRARKVED